jgi:hypothetical protein
VEHVQDLNAALHGPVEHQVFIETLDVPNAHTLQAGVR